jgi:hypothetical protein
MRDEQRDMRESDLSVWRGIFFGIVLGASMWAGILWFVWRWLF